MDFYSLTLYHYSSLLAFKIITATTNPSYMYMCMYVPITKKGGCFHEFRSETIMVYTLFKQCFTLLASMMGVVFCRNLINYSS